MIGNRVRLLLAGRPSEVTGVLHKIEAGAGVTVYRENSLPEGRGVVFIPMHRVMEIVDLGRPL